MAIARIGPSPALRYTRGQSPPPAKGRPLPVNDTLLVVLKLGAVFLLVLTNGYFVAAEFALVSVRRTRIDELVEHGNAPARVVQRATADLTRYIAATQLGVTMASLGLGSLGEPTVGRLLEHRFGAAPGGHIIAVVIAFALITSLHIIVGELTPKSVAFQRPERTALVLTPALVLFAGVFRPFIALLSAGGRAVVRLLGMEPASGEEMVHSVEELKMLVEASAKAGALDPMERQLVGRAFTLGDFQTHEVMLPRTEIAAVPVSANGRDLLALAEQSGHSRFPVYEEDLDHVVGIVHVKDALTVALTGDLDRFAVRDAMRPPLFVPATAPADSLLDVMREQGVQLACVADEFGGLAGIVTFERILERLVGAVRDEFAEPEPLPVAPQQDGSFLVDGLVLISELNDQLELHLDEREYDTVGGLTFGLLGHKPELGEVAQADGVLLEVAELDGLRVARVRLRRHGAEVAAS